MKTGKSLVELAQEIERQRETRKDFIAEAKSLEMGVIDNKDVGITGLPEAHLGGVAIIGLNSLAHGQLAAHLNVPTAYYDRMRERAPTLLAQNVNHWLGKSDDKRLVRTLDGNVRAWLSNAYKPLDNADLAEAVLPALQDLDVIVMSCEITERRLYIKAVDRRIERDVPRGGRMGEGHQIFDTCSPAITISNSEVGFGQLSIETGVWTRQCTNMATFSQNSMKRRHVGGRHELAEGFTHLLTDETRRKTDEALWLQVRDVVKGAFEEAQFDAALQGVKDMAQQRISGDPVKVIDFAAKALDIREMEKPSILRHLIEGGDLSRYGLFNAVTRTGEDQKDYDRATDFERMGGKVIDLSADAWKVIAEAA